MVVTVNMFFAVLAATIFTLASAQSGFCPNPTGDFPNPNSELCTTFFRCFQGNPVLLRCPGSQRFDFLFRICRPQRAVDCNNQLQVYAAPAVNPALGGLGGRIGALPGSGGIGGLGSLGGFGGGQLGAGLPDGGLLTLLSQLEGDGQNGSNSNSLATVLMMSALMNRRNAPPQQQGQQPSPFAGSFYPPNAVNTAFLPGDQNNNPIWQQQPGGGYPGASQGNTVTMADGKTYMLLPQAQGGYGQAPSQFATLMSAAGQSQNILLDKSAPKGADQLQRLIAQPPSTDAGTTTKVEPSNKESNTTTS